MSLEATLAVGARERALLGGEMAGDQTRALADAARVLQACGVPFALIGGLAVGVRSGVPRATLDCDLAIRSATDLDSLIRAFEGDGFTLTGRFAHSMNFRHASGEPVQLAIDAAFDGPVERAEPVRLGALEIPVVTTADLVELKRRAAADPGRRKSKALRDLADVELLLGDRGDPDEGW